MPGGGCCVAAAVVETNLFYKSHIDSGPTVGISQRQKLMVYCIKDTSQAGVRIQVVRG